MDKKSRVQKVQCAPHWWYERCADKDNFPEFYDYYLSDDFWKENSKYFDKDFISQAKADPFSMFYEVYIFRNLISLFELQVRSDNELDFVSNDQSVAFECVVPCIDAEYNESKNRVLIVGDCGHELKNAWIKVDEDLKKLRYSNAIKQKLNQFYGKRMPDSAFVACICGSKLEAGEARDKNRDSVIEKNSVEYGVPYSNLGTSVDPMLQLLFGKQEVVEFGNDVCDFKVVDQSVLRKKGEILEDIHGLFRMEENAGLSGVIFTPYDGIRMKKEELKSFLYINPNAKVKLNKEIKDKLFNFCYTLC